MNLRKHKRAYLSILLVVVSVAIVGALIALTSRQTLLVDEKLKSGIEGSTIALTDCDKKKDCSAKRLIANIAITNTEGISSRVKTNIDGRFKMKLAPGTYTASASDVEGKSTAPSQQVTVIKDKYTKITFNFE
jgi:hypothetical protein